MLATLGKESLPSAETPWVWLASLTSDDIDTVIGQFSERDQDEFEDATEYAEEEFDAAAKAHAMMRLALMHPELLDTDAAARIMSSSGAAEPLHHIGLHTLLALGTTGMAHAVRTSPSEPLRAAAQMILHPLQAFDSGDDDVSEKLYRVLEDLLPAGEMNTDERREHTRVFLELIALAASGHNVDVTVAARQLLWHPAAMACVVVDMPEDDEQHTLQRLILAEIAAVSPVAAGQLARDLPSLSSDDPRDEPALRSEVAEWWSMLQRYIDSASLDSAVSTCPEPGASLLQSIPVPANDETAAIPATWATATAVEAVVQALSALSIAVEDDLLPHEIITSTG